jgi:hypothetical protein
MGVGSEQSRSLRARLRAPRSSAWHEAIALRQGKARNELVLRLLKSGGISSDPFAFSILRSPKVLSNSTEVSTSRGRLVSTTYKNRTKSRNSAGLERNCPTQRISGWERLTAVQRFARECPQTWGISARSARVRETLQKGIGGPHGIRTRIQTILLNLGNGGRKLTPSG